MIFSAPARVNVLGNPTDALEGAYAVISAALTLRAYVEIKQSEEELLDLFKSCLLVIKEYFPEEYRRIGDRPVSCKYWTEIPREAGLAGSTALTTAFMYGLREVYGLNRRKLNDYILAELIQRAEEKAGVTCGYADRYVCLMGGLAYMDFRGKLYHRPLRKEPLTTYERLERYVKYIPLLIAYLGVRRSSSSVHRKFRSAYMKELELVKKEVLKPKDAKILKAMRIVGLTAMKGKYALLEENWTEFGRLMNINHKWVNIAMKLAGFKHGAGYYNNAVINYALRKGALGAKLSGAGGGGSVIVLVEPGKEENFAKDLEKYMKSLGLSSSRVFRFRLSEEGARSEKI
ncbi:MAG: hypothetical protein DRJ52_09705 [Thermoprotei archaeon]|nr:MAG: hypothetical protein DRJ52_09705 [Thermoprotei archaeon]HDI74671.1 hypothetical protein [Thermoprotei archaeon]